ncbi:MAG TPA: energy transducer TonB [Steroidobacteraceae bacterium]|nr:energy transducer TonB [Steroidobacteraceae bacterium]
MNIDYSNILPGDNAPDPDDPAARKSSPAAQPAHAAASHAHPAGQAGHATHATGTHAALKDPGARTSGANVVVLSADPTLIDLLRDAVAGHHRVWRADDATHAADLMVASGNAVLLIDAALADHDTKSLVNQVHGQFPDLAIIVAGRRDDEHELAPLVSEGVIFRFLHKPASAERIRNFVDATQRRANGTDFTATLPPKHKNTLFGGTAEVPALSAPLKLNVDEGFKRRWVRRSLLLIPIALIAWGIAVWEPWNRDASGDAPSPAAASAAKSSPADDARLQRMLDAAGVALSQGALIEPPGQNALELYRSVLTRDPGNDLARRGIESVADELIVQAERALMEQDVTRLASAVDAVRSVRPDHPRLAFFVSQLEQERALQGKEGQPVRAVDTMGRPIETPAPTGELPSVRVQAFVQLANDRMRANQLVGRDGALGYVVSARRIDASDPGVVAAVDALGNQFEASAQKAIRENRLDDANRWYQNSVELNLDRARLASLRADIDAARIGNERADRARLLVLANQRIAQGRLIEPKGDSAQHYVDLVRAVAPQFEGVADTRALLASRALAEARTAMGANNLDRADALVRAAADAGAPSAEVADLNAKIMSMRVVRPAAGVTPEPTVLAENKMRRTVFVPPSYPDRARERGTEGWVDLEFTVAKDGTTQDAVVRAAEPAGTFDRAALDAVRRWRYEPRVVEGNVVEQRVETRVRFRLAE